MNIKFKAESWDKELSFDLTKINVFVGHDISSIFELFEHVNNKLDIITYKYLGNEWYYTENEIKMMQILESIMTSDKSSFIHINSLEIIKILSTCITKLDLNSTFNMIRIGRSAKKSNKGEPTLTYIQADVLAAMLEMKLEMR